MTSASYTNLLTNWFRVHISLPRKTNMTASLHRTGYAAAYPEIKRHHRRQSNLFSCIPLCYKSKKKNKTHLLNNNESKQYRKHSSIKGCASFARFGTYQEGDTEEDC
ncbi:unnamed protein product [Rotaria sp. Silwood2]|nr:unnamed protein product [Rotaria sp. Silwood2]CAF2592642.1 unnamed protein product [Rotaria sp. Silwood2]CAF2833038.1 unnamed protein product [Rotaria sp. Silwood2]CAF2977097.1 unnamed protein product [Rotaria sp. Silwood2]CAF4197040.1 unnamed protein product [Rotaria sp. Silwood2]